MVVGGVELSCKVVKKYCSQMTYQMEAQFYLNSCGVKRLDADKDGVACEDLK
jgi:hypothetical protein